MTDQQGPNHTEGAREVDRVRDIIFGPQMRNYDQRFQLVQRDLERLRQQLDQLQEQISEQDLEQTKRLQALRREGRQADDDLRSELRQIAQKLVFEKADRIALAELFIQIGTHLKTGDTLSSMLNDVLSQSDQDHHSDSRATDGA